MANYWQLAPWIEGLSRWFLAGVMIFAAVPKLSDPSAFAETVGAYGLLPDFLLSPTAVMLPCLELITAFLLIKGRSSGLWISATLMLLFIAVLSYGIWLGLDIDCGCFGPEDIESKTLSRLRAALVRDLLLCIPIIYCFIHRFIHPSKLPGEKQ
ncbi:MAG: hypothetical protein KJO32_09935 [Deltaproteobacteria bacterium]|nr:hypothetical protein [Deltaproteobacteria bacterium]